MHSVHNASVAAQKRRLSESECKQADVPQPVQETLESKQCKTDYQQELEQEQVVVVQKRRFSQSELKPADLAQPVQEQPEPKQRKTEHQQVLKSHDHNLLSFCNELLFEIFKYLDSSSIMAMMLVSPRFESLLLDHRFWHNIDTSKAPLPFGILEEILGRATEKTHTIKICGPPSSQHVSGEFKQFTCTLTSIFPKVSTQLRVLELQGVSLDFEYIHISEFPASLKRLTLKDCSVKVGDHVKSIFHTIEKQLINLEDLSIEDNSWFEPYYIMALSKLPSLRRLSLKGCQSLCKFVPYGSMAARFGFQKLEVLDLRLTPINNADLQCFSAIETLRELLLESPPNLPQEATLPAKTFNGTGNEEPNPTQPDHHKILSDDEPSTSRAAMEHLRACKIAQGNETTTDSQKPQSDTFTSDNCNERKDGNDMKRSSSSARLLMRRGSSESDDEDTSSTSASSSDKSDNPSSHSNGISTAAGASVQSQLVLIALPSVARDRSPPPAQNAENAENPEPAAAAGAATPRAYIYVQNGAPPESPRPADPLITLHGNCPAYSRFLPRRDQVIYMNPQAMAEPMLVMHPRRHRAQARGNFEQVVQHPMFWNMLDPLDREYARRRSSRPHSSSLPTHYFVSDRAIYSFGRPTNPVQADVVWIRNSPRCANNRLERISLRNYPYITNYTLEHLVQCSPNLRYIDVSGTSITMLGLRIFIKLKPHCEVIATHLTTSEQQPETEELVKSEQETEQDPSENCSIDNDEKQHQQQQQQPQQQQQQQQQPPSQSSQQPDEQ
ncbi:uncharacterized protein LOC117789692 isoform X2 [Drosophila innubila]|uniref:uncharacterized protein LOC117789692 isoform X2 n=1 Tax=Drosophila innubila TaxID=198719 RepID=UPI00148D8820|nr:uncharacterized protein LOC117789692 isoform X2 [Drosophila innubila]